MKKLIYIGNMPEIELNSTEGIFKFVRGGDAVSVPEVLAVKLLEEKPSPQFEEAE